MCLQPVPGRATARACELPAQPVDVGTAPQVTNGTGGRRDLRLLQETRRELDAGTPLEQIPDVVAGRLRERFAHLRGFNGIVRDNVRRTLTYYGMGW